MGYINYMVSAIYKDGTSWMYSYFDDIATAKMFCDSLIPANDPVTVEIWGTNEDVNTFHDAETLYIRELATEKKTDLTKVRELARRLYDEESGESLMDIKKDLMTVDGCHKYIEYLLDTIDSILE